VGVPGGRPRSDAPAGDVGAAGPRRGRGARGGIHRGPGRGTAAPRPGARRAARGALVGLLGLLAASLGPAACERAQPPIELSFSVAGSVAEEAAAGPTFGPQLADATGYWLYDPPTGRTQVHLSGRDGRWRVGLDLALPLAALGRYRSDTSYRGVDRAFQLTLHDTRDGRHLSLVAAGAEVELDEYDPGSGVLGGRFEGRFAVGHRTSGVDILSQPEAERRYVRVGDGRFRLPFRDTLSGRGTLWPTPGSARR